MFFDIKGLKMELIYGDDIDEYPLEAVNFYDDYDGYLEDEKDEFGFKMATKETFAIFDKAQEGLSEKIYAKYLRCKEELRKYIMNGGEL